MLNFVNLRRMGTTADLVLLAPETWASESVETIGGLLTTMTADYGVILRYIAPWAAQQLDVDSACAVMRRVSLLHALRQAPGSSRSPNCTSSSSSTGSASSTSTRTAY